MQFFSDAHYRFIELRKGAYVVSACLLLAGMAAMVFNVVSIGSWQNYGVDFTGGSLVQVAMSTDATTADVRAVLPGDYGVTRFEDADESGQNEFVIRAPAQEEQDINQVRSGIEEILADAFGEGTFEVTRTELVGPKIGSELQTKAASAILFSFVLTLIYLAIRFETRFGIAAVIATLHDITITLGFLALFRVEIALPTVAAILTIVGYSLNDTIVVFDRIRENLAAKGARKEDPVDLVNRSINETLPRTVLTSGTTLAVLLALLLVGPVTIRDFAIVLILGVLIGTYSSIFVASPALLEIEERYGKEKKGKRGGRARRPQPETV